MRGGDPWHDPRMTVAWLAWMALASEPTGHAAMGDRPSAVVAVEPPVEQANKSAWTSALGGVRRYLERPLGASARFGDHGVWTVAAVPGSPQRYRVETSVGVLDHLELGATAHWLPGQSRPVWSPLASVAFYRSRRFEVGAGYQAVLYAPPVLGEGEAAFTPRARELVGSVAFSQWWFSVGVDLGAAWISELDRFDEVASSESIDRRRLAAGMFARFGNRRFGLIVQGRMPVYAVECALELRFGVFDRRRPDRWLEPTSSARGQ